MCKYLLFYTILIKETSTFSETSVFLVEVKFKGVECKLRLVFVVTYSCLKISLLETYNNTL